MQRTYFDLWRSYNSFSIGGNYYFIIIIDNNIRKMWTYNIISRDIFFSIFKMWKKSDEIEKKLKLCTLQIDNKDKYVNLRLKKFCKEEKVVIEFINIILYTSTKLYCQTILAYI